MILELSAVQRATLLKALAQRAFERGPEILGAQLGMLVAQAVSPNTLKDFGGLRHLVETSLQPVVRLLRSDDGSADHIYSITAAAERTGPLAQVSEPREVAGAELWRLYSNPRITSELAADTAGRVIAVPGADAVPDGYVLLTRPNSTDYQRVAEGFVAQVESESLRDQLLATFSQAEFYSPFVTALRQARAEDHKYLRLWETIRTEHALSQLRAALISAKVDESAARNILELAKPLIPTRPKAVLTAPTPGRQASAPPVVVPQAADGLTELRLMLRLAIDRMDEQDLRAIKVPAGIILDINQRQPR